MRKASRAAAARSKPSHRPAVMLTPERLTPGSKAAACASPILARVPQAVGMLGPLRTSSGRRCVAPPQQPTESSQQRSDQQRPLCEVEQTVLQRDAHQRRGDGREGQAQRNHRVGFGAAADAAPKCLGVAGDVGTQVHRRSNERADVQRDVEGILQLVVAIEEIPTGQPRHHFEVGARRDREELGHSLQQAEHDRRGKIRHRGGL